VAHRFKDLWSRAITFSRAIIRLSRDLMRQHKPQHRQEPDESRHHHRNEQYAHDPIRPAVKRAIVHFDCLPAYRPSIIPGAGPVRHLGEAWCDTTSDVGKRVITIRSGIAEFERKLILSRTEAGITKAREQGKKFGRPSALDQKRNIAECHAAGETMQA
jgi:hypothetical protein